MKLGATFYLNTFMHYNIGECYEIIMEKAFTVGQWFSFIVIY